VVELVADAVEAVAVEGARTTREEGPQRSGQVGRFSRKRQYQERALRLEDTQLTVNRKVHISQPLFLKNQLTLGNGQLQGKGKGRELVAMEGASLLGGRLKGTSTKNMRELHSRMGSRAICNKDRVVVNRSKVNMGPSQSLLATPSLRMKGHQLELQCPDRQQQVGPEQ
jgi:hypothetical protein